MLQLHTAVSVSSSLLRRSSNTKLPKWLGRPFSLVSRFAAAEGDAFFEINLPPLLCSPPPYVAPKPANPANPAQPASPANPSPPGPPAHLYATGAAECVWGVSEYIHTFKIHEYYTPKCYCVRP